MADSEPLVCSTTPEQSFIGEKDDFNGMIINMPKYINFPKLVFLWLTFIAIHSGIFYKHVLKRFPSTITDGEMNWKGVLIGSIVFMFVLTISDFIFKK